jgi:site-specific DNA-methyltransferase (adenine-specific)
MPKSEVFNMDCMEGMSQFPDKYFDLAIVDPPFGLKDLNKNKFRRHKEKTTYTNDSIPGADYFAELERVSKASIIWGCQYMMEHLNPDGSFVIWNKKADPDLHNMSACDVAWYSKRSKIRIFDGHWCGAVKIDNEQTIHPHQKPVALYDWLLFHYAQSSFKILDTHLGSGSHRIAAERYGLDFTGFEMDKTHFDNSELRFKQYKSQLNLFTKVSVKEGIGNG